MKLGEINRLKCIRKSDLGFMLSDGCDDVLLHYKESTKELKENEEIDVFLFTDKKGRLCATMNSPYTTINSAGFVKVVGSIGEIGVFIDNACSKDILVSKDNLPYNFNYWPKVGDTLYCKLKIKKGILLAKPLNRFEITEDGIKVNYEISEQVIGYVCHISDSGLGVITNYLDYIFIPNFLKRGDYRLGQEVNVTITKKLDNEYYGTMIQNKELMIDPDKNIILEYLKNHNGIMKFTAKTCSKEIEDEFKISRKAFKRALGSLFKDGKIICTDYDTKLVKKD